MKKIILMVLIIIIFGCSSNNTSKKEIKIPKWVNDYSIKYPKSRYLVAIGRAQNQENAENNAMANLSKIFESKIKADQTVIEKQLEKSTKGGGDYYNKTEMLSKVNVKSEQTLLNVKYGESFVSSRGEYIVLAYIDRIETGDLYQEKINNNCEIIKKWQMKAEKSDNPIDKYGYYFACYELANKNNLMLSQLYIISSTYKEFVKIDYEFDEIVNKLIKYGKWIIFDINIQNDNDNFITNRLSELITTQGFTVRKNGNFSINGNLILKSLDLNRKEAFVRWNLSLDLIENQKTIISIQKNGREGHINLKEAEIRALKKMMNKMEIILLDKFRQYFQKYSQEQ